MNIIAQSADDCKRVKLIRGGLGYVIKGQKEKYRGVPPPQRGRGDITTFSRASSRRLRESLALAKLKGAEATIWGLTLTIPGRILAPSEVRRLWKDFTMMVRKYHGDTPLLWRIELQKRKQAHWHCVVWAEKGRGAVVPVMLGELWKSTARRHVGALREATDMGFDKFGAKLRCLDGSTATGVIGYLADHTSKHKREQLGWQGRQWGIINRARLDFEGEVVAELSEDEHKHAARQFRRLQENLREKGGAYTGGGVTPSGNIQRSVFGRDAGRYLACVQAEQGAPAASDGGARASAAERGGARLRAPLRPRQTPAAPIIEEEGEQ